MEIIDSGEFAVFLFFFFFVLFFVRRLAAPI